MASNKAPSGLWTLALAVALALQCAAAADHVVGGSSGWTIPSSPSFYQTWAKNQTFKVGDKLVFRFQTGNHNALRVSKANYDSCATTNSLEALNTGPATTTLSKSGTYYFICGFPGHCSAGQKVALAVGSGTAATPSPATSPAPSASAPAPAASASSPGPSATGAAPSAGGPSAPSASSPAAAPSGKSASAGSRASLGGLVAVLSLAASFFLRM